MISRLIDLTNRFARINLVIIQLLRIILIALRPQKVVAKLFKIGRQAGAIAKWGNVVVSEEPHSKFCGYYKIPYIVPLILLQFI